MSLLLLWNSSLEIISRLIKYEPIPFSFLFTVSVAFRCYAYLKHIKWENLRALFRELFVHMRCFVYTRTGHPTTTALDKHSNINVWKVLALCTVLLCCLFHRGVSLAHLMGQPIAVFLLLLRWSGVILYKLSFYPLVILHSFHPSLLDTCSGIVYYVPVDWDLRGCRGSYRNYTNHCVLRVHPYDQLVAF